MEGRLLRNTTRILISVLLLTPGAWAARDLTSLRVRGVVLACPVANPDAGERSILEAIDKGKFDKARRKLASLRLESMSRPQLPLLAALADFAQGARGAEAGLDALLDPAVPSHAQVRAELAALGGDACRAAGLYAAVPASLVEAMRLKGRLDRLGAECLEGLSTLVDERWSAGDFGGLEGLAAALPPPLGQDPRAIRALFPAAVLAGDALRARALLDRLSLRDRGRYGPLVTALELDPSLRLSYLKEGGSDLLEDPLGRTLYARAQDEWLVGNMPEDFRRAWAAPAMSRRDLALLICLHFPGLKGGAVPGIELPEAVLEDPQADCLAALASQGFLPEYQAGEPVTVDGAIRALGRALEAAGLVVPCGPGAREWVRCGLLPDSPDEGAMSGQQWSALAHRVRGDLP